MVAAHAALTGRTVNIPDASRAVDFDLSGARAFDQETGYHSRSLLTVPLRDHEGEVIGVLQLINAIHPVSGQVVPFSLIRMLEALPYPKSLRHVPEYACSHHERMDGTGYPRGLTREQMSIPARALGIADVFEALTAKERPYKEGMKLSRALAILGQMRLDHHVDPDLFDVFVREKVYLRYAERFLDPEQIDAVDEGRIPGFTP